MIRNVRLSVCRFMLIAMFAMQGLLAWHDSVHVLESHVAVAGHVHHGDHHQAGDVCDLCLFAQDFAKILIWHGPVPQSAAVRPYFEAAQVPVYTNIASLRFYIARAPPAV